MTSIDLWLAHLLTLTCLSIVALSLIGYSY